MSNLYELSGTLKKIHDELEITGGELTVDLERLLDESSLAFKEKVEGLGSWMLNLDGNLEGLDKEIIRLVNRKTALENLKGRLKEYVKTSMETADIQKLEFPSFTLALQKSPPSCEVWNEKEIPARFITIVPESRKVDKKAVLEALKAGEKVEGAKLNEPKYHLRQR